MLVIAGAFIVAGIAKGAIGMGMPPIAIGLMSFALPLESAIAIMVVPTMVTNIWQAIYGGGFRPLMRRFGTMATTAMIGILGVGLLFSNLGSPSTTGLGRRPAGALFAAGADAVAATGAARASSVGQSADRAGERRRRGLDRRRGGAVPALHAVARHGPARARAGARHHVHVHHRHARRVARPARRLSPHQQRGRHRRGGADHGGRVARPKGASPAVAGDVPPHLHLRHAGRGPAPGHAPCCRRRHAPAHTSHHDLRHSRAAAACRRRREPHPVDHRHA